MGSKAFVKIGETILKKQSIVVVEPADMLSPQSKKQVKVRVSGLQNWKYIATDQTADDIIAELNAE